MKEIPEEIKQSTDASSCLFVFQWHDFHSPECVRHHWQTYTIFLSVNLLEFSLPDPRNSKSVVLNIHNFHIYFLLQFTETQVNHRVRKDRKYRITLCYSLILTFIEFVTWHCGKDRTFLCDQHCRCRITFHRCYDHALHGRASSHDKTPPFAEQRAVRLLAVCIGGVVSYV